MAAGAASAADGPPRRPALRVGGRPIILVMVGVWLVVLALTVVMVVRFKLGGIDALRMQPRAAEAPGAGAGAPGAAK